MFGKSIDNKNIKNIKLELQKLKNLTQKAFQDFDLILMPTTPQNSFQIKDKTPANQANFTSLANIADLPALSLPFCHNKENNHSIQIIASNQNDSFLLKTSSFLKKPCNNKFL